MSCKNRFPRVVGIGFTRTVSGIGFFFLMMEETMT